MFWFLPTPTRAFTRNIFFPPLPTPHTHTHIGKRAAGKSLITNRFWGNFQSGKYQVSRKIGFCLHCRSCCRHENGWESRNRWRLGNALAIWLQQIYLKLEKLAERMEEILTGLEFPYTELHTCSYRHWFAFESPDLHFSSRQTYSHTTFSSFHA